MVESDSDTILKDADKVNVAFLVVGDPFGYILRYRKENIFTFFPFTNYI